ncbi:MAG: GNAT family N-acetyltransferase [Cytophagales bacterium]|nr:GNAT family N-acetyltransferase [Cytophagales bacterium]
MEFKIITSDIITPDDFDLLKAVALLFYQPEYLNAQNYENPVAFTVFEQSKLSAAITLNCNDGIATSLNRSPFGSIWMNNKLSKETLHQFLDFIKTELAKMGIQKIQIICPSPIYAHAPTAEFWIKEGFRAFTHETNQHLIVKGAFDAGLHQMERRKLKKLRSGKIYFARELISNDLLSECHDFIDECRQEQGLKINISIDKLKELCFSMDGRYEVFTARAAETLVAAVIACRVDQNHLYYYLPATDNRYRRDSPMVGLLELIYETCRDENIQYLDLGISSIDGQLQQGLYDFKQRLGAVQTTKSTFYLEW